MQPLIDAGQEFIERQEQVRDLDARALLEGFFDFHYEHRADMLMVLTEMTTLAELGLIDVVLEWRARLTRLLFAEEPSLQQATRGVMALGGMQDCTMQFPDVPREELRAATVDAAMAALGLSE